MASPQPADPKPNGVNPPIESRDDANPSMPSPTPPQPDLIAVPAESNVVKDGDLLPCPVPPGYPKLDFKPLLLRKWFSIAAITFFLGVLAGTFTVFFVSRSRGRPFKTSNTFIYVVARFIPATVGTITAVTWKSMDSTLHRITPYISMAAERTETMSEKYNSPTRTLAARYFPLFSYSWANRHNLLLVHALTVFPMTFIISLKSAFLTTTEVDGGWETTVSEPVAWVLIGLYIGLTIVTVIKTVRLWNRDTGLKWDPKSIADQIALFHGSNALEDFQNLEYLTHRQVLEFLSETPGRYRLGYWTRREGGEYWYGIARLPGTKPPAIQLDNQSPGFYPYTDVYWQLESWTLGIGSFFLCAFLALAIYGLASKKLQHGFAVASNSLSVGVFVFQGVLVYFSAFLAYNVWMVVDIFYRGTQPFVGMYDKAQPADENLLLGYLYDLPGIVSINAALNGHWKVAWLSFLAITSTVVPILVGAAFTIGTQDEKLFITTRMPTFALIFVFFVIWLASVPVAWPTRSRKLPRELLTTLDVISFCYASKLVRDPVFDVSEPHITRRHLEAKLFLGGNRYLFGRYEGTDGKTHIGFDVVAERGHPDHAEDTVQTIPSRPYCQVRRRGRIPIKEVVLDILCS